MTQDDERDALKLRIWTLEYNYGPREATKFDPTWDIEDLKEYEQILICDQSTRGPKPWSGFPVEPPKPTLAPVPTRSAEPSSEAPFFECPDHPPYTEAFKMFAHD